MLKDLASASIPKKRVLRRAYSCSALPAPDNHHESLIVCSHPGRLRVGPVADQRAQPLALASWALPLNQSLYTRQAHQVPRADWRAFCCPLPKSPVVSLLCSKGRTCCGLALPPLCGRGSLLEDCSCNRPPQDTCSAEDGRASHCDVVISSSACTAAGGWDLIADNWSEGLRQRWLPQ